MNSESVVSIPVMEGIKLVMNYLLIPLVIYMLREMRLLADAMHKLDVRTSVLETTVGQSRRLTDLQEN